MGTDIHVAVERWDGQKWNWTGLQVNRDRNYDLFSILADVRNGTGFAGVVTGAGFVPISKPRGFPIDVDPRSVEMPDDDGTEASLDAWRSRATGYHDATWLLLSEILDYDYSQKTIHTGVVDEETYMKYRETGELGLMSGSVWGLKCVTLNEGEYVALLRGKSERRDLTRQEGMHYYVQINYEDDYLTSVKDWLDDIRAKLLPLGDPKLTRLIINFDS